MTSRLAQAVAIAALALAHPRLVVAGSCPGGGGGGGSSGGGSSGGGSSGGGSSGGGGAPFISDSHFAGHEPDCSDGTDIVGFRRCTPFATWATNPSTPKLIIEAGAVLRQFASLLDGQIGHVSHGDESFAYRTTSQPQRRALDTAVLSTMRVGAGLPHGLYSALEVDFGGLTQTTSAAEVMSAGAFGGPTLAQEHGFIFDSLAALGIRGNLGRGNLGVELAGGLRAVSYSFHSSYHFCEQDTSVLALGPVAEARVRGELWVSPWLTAGLAVGTSVIEQHTWMGAFYLGLHTRAFDGAR
jgi:hypothetical protein